jgi:anti-sigma regulatory factor (Ser/Thr protein kinase)
VPAISFPVQRVPSAVADVRRRAVNQATEWGAVLDDETCEGLELVVSELVTNAVRYSEGERITVGLVLDVSAKLLTVEACDASRQAPTERSAGAEDEGGRGLLLVDAVAERHGWEPTAEGKRVWAELRIPEVSQRRARTKLLLRRLRAARPRSYVNVLRDRTTRMDVGGWGGWQRDQYGYACAARVLV